MEIYRDVIEYIRALSIGGVGIMSIYPAFNLLRLDGRNNATAAVFLMMAAVNIALSALLLLVLKTGVAGAAISTVCGAGAAGVLGAVLLFTGSKNFRFTFKRGSLRHALDILLSGSPSALDNLCVLLRTMALNRLLAGMLGGLVAVSAFKVTDSVNSFAQIFLAGASGSMIPFIGVFAPEKDTGSIRQLLRLGFTWGCVMSLAFTGICLAFTGPIAALFGMSGAESLPAAVAAVRVFALSLPLAMGNNILVCLYQANRKTAAANLLTFGRSLLWVLLAAYALSSRFGAAGVWNSFWIAELLAFCVALPHTAFYRAKNRYLSPLLLLDTEAEKNGRYECFAVKNTELSITEASDNITKFCKSNGLTRKQTMAIRLAIEEMLVSIHTHALPDDESQTMNVRVLIWEEIVVMRIRNSGKPFNPIEYYEKQKAKQTAGANIMDDFDTLSDSLGIKMILDIASSVDYRSTFGVNNITVII
jgi:anti-sigma regulatory factor (Ser/Thr protein kinase)